LAIVCGFAGILLGQNDLGSENRNGVPLSELEKSAYGSVLHEAVYRDDVASVRQQIASGADVKARNRYGIQPLSLACLNGNAEIIELLLKAGADPNAEMAGGETALMTAARTGRLKPVRLLVDHGAEVGAREQHGQTALMWGAAEGNVEVVKCLIEAGADVHQTVRSGFSPLLFAARNGKSDVVEVLLKSGAEIDRGLPSGVTPLLLAVENGHFELAYALMQHGADPQGKGNIYTPLHALTWVRKPVRGDGDPPPIGSGKMTSLQFARAAVSLGTDVNARHGKHQPNKDQLNRTGATAVLLAAETGDLPYIQLLVELGADPLLQNVDQCSPLLAATGVGVLSDGDDSAGTEEEGMEVVDYLLQQGGDINGVDRRGNTVIHGAAYLSWSKMIPFLVERGADPRVWNRPNKRGRTPLEIAQGHRPGNFRPSPETMRALEGVLQ
jgi:ankyrin repeat protein